MTSLRSLLALCALILFGICGGSSPRADLATHSLLVAAPGLPVAEMLAQSNLKPEGGGGRGVPYIGGGDFDVSVVGTGLTLTQCRYYFIETGRIDPTRIDSLSIALAPDKLSKPELDAADAGLRRELANAGWLAGRKQTDDMGKASNVWLKAGIILHMDARRLDPPVAGENPATAGTWIRFVDLVAVAGYPGVKYMVFEPPAN
jgi:hypothetical protein